MRKSLDKPFTKVDAVNRLFYKLQPLFMEKLSDKIDGKTLDTYQFGTKIILSDGITVETRPSFSNDSCYFRVIVLGSAKHSETLKNDEFVVNCRQDLYANTEYVSPTAHSPAELEKTFDDFDVEKIKRAIEVVKKQLTV